MNINNFARMVTRIEGKKSQVNIAQVKEILRVVNVLTKGILYQIIKLL